MTEKPKTVLVPKNGAVMLESREMVLDQAPAGAKQDAVRKPVQTAKAGPTSHDAAGGAVPARKRAAPVLH